MRYLGDRGSYLQVLAFSPVELLIKAEHADKNGHFWPNYFYYRGRITDYRGTDVAMARPLVNWAAEVPGAKDLMML
jgi:hypothetical protein